MTFKFAYAFMFVYTLGALWLIISGISSFFTKECTIWIGEKTVNLSGKKALWGGALTILVGLALLTLAIHQWHALHALERKTW